MSAALFSEEYSLPCFCVLVCLLVLLCGILLLLIFPAVVPPSLPSSTPAKITVNSEVIDATREPCCSTLVRTIILQMPEMCTEQLSAQKAPKGKLVKAPKCSHVFRVAAHTLGLSQSTTLTTLSRHSEQPRLSVVASKCTQSRESVQLRESVQAMDSGLDASEVDSDSSSAAVHERASEAASKCTRD